MLDPISIAVLVGVLILVAVLFTIFKFATKETSFEEAYGESARKLLAMEERSKKASRGMGKQQKSVKNLNGVKEKKETDERKEDSINSEKSGENDKAVDEELRHRKKKQQTVQEVSGDDTRQHPNYAEAVQQKTAVPLLTKTQNQEAINTNGATHPDTEGEPKKVIEKKHKRKDSNGHTARTHADVVVNQSQVEESKLQTIQPTKATAPAAKKKVAAIAIRKTLKLEDVLASLGNCDMDTEYVEYIRDNLVKYSSQQQQNAKSAELITQLQKALTEKDHHADAAARFSDQEINKLSVLLADQALKYSALEQSSRTQNANIHQHNQKLQQQLTTMQTDVKRAEADRAALKTQMDQLRTQLSEATNRASKQKTESSDLEQRYNKALADLKNRDQQIHTLEDAKKAADVRIEKLEIQSADFEKQKQSWTQMSEQLAALQKELSDLESAKTKTDTNQKATTELAELREKMAEMTKLRDQLQKTSNDADRRVQVAEEGSKKELSALQKELETLKREKTFLLEQKNKTEEMKTIEIAKGEKERADWQRQLKDAQTQLETKQNELQKLKEQMDKHECKSEVKVNGDMDHNEHEMKKVRGELAVANKSLSSKDDEIRQLKQQLSKQQHGNALKEDEAKLAALTRLQAVHVTQTTAPSPVDKEMASLKAEVEEQKRRNNELREKNYKMLEAINAMEQTSKQMVKLAEEKYESLLKEKSSSAGPSSSPMVKHIPDSSSSPSPSPQHLEKKPNNEHFSEAELHELRNKVSMYQTALHEATDGFDRIQQSAISREKECEQRIGHLEEQLRRANDDSKRAQEQLKHFLQTDQQIETLRGQLGKERATGHNLKMHHSPGKQNGNLSDENGDEDIDQLRARLAHSEQQLQCESAMNKQMSEKLATLNVNNGT